MSIPIWNKQTGQVDRLRQWDQAIMDGLGGIENTDPANPCFSIPVKYQDGSTRNVSAYFAQPESIFRLKVFPFFTINRDDFIPAMHRWMNIGQLEYRTGVSGATMVINGVSGFASYVSKQQAIPFDFTYTLSCFDRYESSAQPLISHLLKHFPPLGRVTVFDSFGLQRTYEAYLEGSIANLQELTDPVNRARGYAITVRVEGELDLAEPYTMSAVSGVDLFLHRMK